MENPNSKSDQTASGAAFTQIGGVDGEEKGGSISCTSTSQNTNRSPYRFLPTQTCGVYRGGNLTASNVSSFMSNQLSSAKILNVNLPVQPLDVSLPVQPLDVNLPVQSLDVNLPVQPLDVNLPVQPLDFNLPVQPLDVNLPVNAVQTLGSYVGGNFTAQTVAINVNPSSPKLSEKSKRVPFRFNIPMPTKHFKGREDTLVSVQQYLNDLPSDTSDCCARTVVIAGSGGMGKTETAYKFAAKFKKTFPCAAWIDAETQEGLLKSFLELAKTLRIAPENQECADVHLVKKVYRHVDREDYGKVLFIFDNALRFNSVGTEFGIYDYLPTEDLVNQRYPYVLITTQTHEWGKQIKIFQVDALSVGESLEFFRSSFRVESTDCYEEFKRLHEVTEGYPLVMNLAASNIEYSRNNDSLCELQQKINLYIQELEKETWKILTEQMKQWPTSYKKTLAAAWQLTFKRLEEEPNGPEALRILQIMSFLNLPMNSKAIETIIISSTECYHPSNFELELGLKEIFHMLERFYARRILQVRVDHDYAFHCSLGMHRLVQLAVRQQTNCSQALESVLCYECTRCPYEGHAVNTSAIAEQLQLPELTTPAMLYVGTLACRGRSFAYTIVETKKPVTKAAAVIWRLYHLGNSMKTLNNNTILVCRQLIGLTKSAKLLRDRQFFAWILLELLSNPDRFDYERHHQHVDPYFNIFKGIEEQAAKLILDVLSLEYAECCSRLCPNYHKTLDTKKARLLKKLITYFVQLDGPYAKSSGFTLALFLTFPRLMEILSISWLGELLPLSWLFKPMPVVEYLTNVWLLLFSPHAYGTLDEWQDFWSCIYGSFDSLYASPSKIATLRASLWNHGLSKLLIQIFRISKLAFGDTWITFTQCIDVCFDGMYLKDARVQQVISAFAKMTARIRLEYLNSTREDDVDTCYHACHFLCDVYSVWINLLLMEQPSEFLLECMSNCGALTWFEGFGEDIFRKSVYDCYLEKIPDKYTRRYYPQFVQWYSSSEVKQMKTLLTYCNILMELQEPYAYEYSSSD